MQPPPHGVNAIRSADSGAYRFTGTLLDRLREAARQDRQGTVGITFIEGATDGAFLSYSDLLLQAEIRARQMGGAGISPGAQVLLPIEDNREFAILFWASLIAGAIPVPIAGAAHDELNLKLLRIWRVLDQPRLVTSEARFRKLEGFGKADAIWHSVASAVLPLEQLRATEPGEHPPWEPEPGDLAFLQFSSGSTGDPKGVCLTHANLLANIGSTLRGSRAESTDSMLSWMPMSHDMGLIGVHLRSVCAVYPQHLMPTSLFIRRPMLWLESVHKYRATHLCCPNFGYQYLLSSYDERAAAAWDLSCIRVISNGAEPISHEVARRFCTAMARHGMDPGVIQACYGLAENTLAVSLSVPGEPLTVWHVARDSAVPGETVRQTGENEGSLALVDCGQIVDTTDVCIAGDAGEALPDLQVGRVLIAGPSTSEGYFNNPEATVRTIRDGWLDTGDLGFRSADRLIITGRAKEVIILNGANFYPHDIERVVEGSLGLEGGNAVAFGCRSPGSASEFLVLFVRHKGSATSFIDLAGRVRREIAGRMGIVVSDVVQVRKIPKTSSGKIQRYKLATAWEQGEFRGPDMPAVKPQRTDSLRAVAELALGLTSSTEIDPDRALADQGFDSLKAVELSSRLGTSFGFQLPVSLVFDYPTLRAIAAHVDSLVANTGSEPAPHQRMGIREPLAIIGVGLRLPGGVRSLTDYWRLLAGGVDAITEVPADRWDVNSLYDPDPERAGTMTTRWGAFVEGVDRFDARFFEISGAEAKDMDPQQRLLLETSWEALENGAQSTAELKGQSVGVFVGISSQDYVRRHVDSGDLRRIGPYALTGSSPSASAGRISYCFGFEGPCMAVDTACSSSLVAVHLAARSLQSGECSMALAAGVNLILGPEVHVGFSKMRAMAADGRCKTFDASADGYVRGEGCVVIAMKRLSDALASRDPILAVLRGSAVNQDGASNGFTAPNGLAQQAVIRLALDDAGVAPASVGYVEAHGTGTPLGDPQEMAALAAVYARGRPPEQPLRVGSVKTNLGHMEAAAGLAGLVKVALCLSHGTIPPSLNFRTPTPNIPWNKIPVEVPTRLETWREDQPRLAAVSSFGFSGTNVHAVLEAPPRRSQSVSEAGPALLLPISAKSGPALHALRGSWIELLSHEDADAGALCRTNALRRAHFPWRLTVAGANRPALLEALRGSETPRHATASGRPKVAFVFPGQGSQWAGMGREMMQHSLAFREAIEECGKVFGRYLDWDFAAAIASGDRDYLSQIDRIQPALFGIEVALARAWQAFGIKPDAVIGHSMGEAAAAHLAGALSLDDAARIICCRSSLLLRISGNGAMCSVDLSLEEAAAEIGQLGESVSVAASNAPGATVLAGTPEAIDGLLGRLEARGVFARRIKVDVASHSPQVDVLTADLQSALAGIQPRAGEIPIYSTVTAGARLTGTELGTQYWIDNLRRPVMFSSGMQALLADGFSIFIEMTPHPILVPFVETTVESAGLRAFATGTLRRDEPEMVEFYSALGRAWQAGGDVNWKQLYAGPFEPVELPPYPWQRESYWLDQPDRTCATATYPDLGRPIEIAGEKTVLRECEIGVGDCGWLADHRVDGAVVFPAAALVELAFRAVGEGTPSDLVDVRFPEPLSLRPDSKHRLQIRLGNGAFDILGRDTAEGGDWVSHCTGRVRPRIMQADGVDIGPHVSGNKMGSDELYRRLHTAGLEYGPAFRLVESAWPSGKGVEAAVRGHMLSGLVFSPAFLDSCFQALGAIGGDSGLWIPAGIASISCGAAAGRSAVVRGEFREETPYSRTADLIVRDEVGARTFTVKGLRLQPLSRVVESGSAIYEVKLRSVETIPPAPSGQRVEVAGPGKWFKTVDPGRGGQVTDVVYVAAPMSCGSVEELDASEPVEEVTRLMRCIQALSAREGDPPRFRLLTRESSADPVQTALRGFFRSAVREYPELRPVAIEYSAAPSADELRLALTDWPEAEPEIVIQGAAAFVPRICFAKRSDAEHYALPTEAIQAELGRVGDPESIAFTPLVRRAPGAGEVEVEVAASGLNFLNVLSAMGLYPGYPGGFRSLGIECAGRVTRCGEGVSLFRPGDDVFGIAEHTLATHVIARAVLLARNPGLHANLAAALPVAYLTAAWSLRHLARLEAGETVLIHAALGGVGRAAIEVARGAGARILATAGSPERREVLVRMGIEHVFDSRSIDFEHAVREATGGRGVDVVLNSLAGDAIEAGLRCLAPFGRFVEIGKRELYGSRRIALESFREGISYFVVDLDRLAKERTEAIGSLWRELTQEIASGRLNTLPVQEYGFGESAAAFREMAQSRHSGKVVLVRCPDEAIAVKRNAAVPRISAESTYLVTGGVGLVGMLVAEWILREGGRHIVLASRGGGTDAVLQQVSRWNAEGANVRIVPTDLTQAGSVNRLLSTIQRAMPPLAGIVHAAGTLADTSIANMDAPAVQTVFAAKMGGALNLHAVTLDIPLDFFVMISSAAGVLGPAGQANYAAANASLCALGEARRSQKLPAVAVALGPVAGGGLAAGANSIGRASSLGDLPLLRPEAVAGLLFEAAASAGVHPIAMDLTGFQSQETCFEEVAAGPAYSTKPDTARAHILAIPSREERLRALEDLLVMHAARLVRCDPASIDAEAPFKTLGLDSLMAMQLRNRLHEELDVRLSVTTFWNYPSPREYARFLAGILEPGNGAPSRQRSTLSVSEPAANTVARSSIEELTEAEAERLLMEKI